MRRLCIVALLLAVVGVAHADRYPLAKYPPGSEVIESASLQYLNGTPLLINHFRIREPLSWVKRWYLKEWEEEVVETEFNGWLQLGRYYGTVMYTVQLRDSGDGVEGRLAISDYDSPKPKPFNIPADSLVITDNVHADESTEGRMVVLVSSQGSDYLARWYAENYEQRGYKLLGMQVEQYSGALIMRYGKGARNANVVIFKAQQGQSQIMVTETRGVNL